MATSANAGTIAPIEDAPRMPKWSEIHKAMWEFLSTQGIDSIETLRDMSPDELLEFCPKEAKDIKADWTFSQKVLIMNLKTMQNIAREFLQPNRTLPIPDNNHSPAKSTPTKPPTHLDPTILNQYLKEYKESANHDFPIEKLAGAESIIARLHWEKTNGYEALTLDAVTSRKIFNNRNGINMKAIGAKKQKLDLTDGCLVLDDKAEATTARTLSWFTTAVQDIALAWKLVKLGNASPWTIDDHTNWWIALAQQFEDNLDKVSRFWQQCQVHLCSRLNRKENISDIFTAIQNDKSSLIDDIMSNVTRSLLRGTGTTPSPRKKGRNPWPRQQTQQQQQYQPHQLGKGARPDTQTWGQQLPKGQQQKGDYKGDYKGYKNGKGTGKDFKGKWGGKPQAKTGKTQQQAWPPAPPPSSQ